jgi:4-hydroxybenzoate polyprenyltransferase
MTFVVPDTVFGIAGALAGPLLTRNESPSLLVILSRLPQVLLYNWANLLIFDLANQRLPEAVVEDALNKPWRPLPTGRITIPQTRRLLLASLPIVLAVNWSMRAWEETILLFSLTWMYNDLKGGEEDFIVRNLIIGLAFGLYNGGALKIACGVDHSITAQGYYWLVLISGVIFTTMQIQDLKDQVGDQARGRRSAPLVLGDAAARWTIAVPVIVWSIVCPLFLGLGFFGYLVPCGVGSLIVGRLFILRGVNADRSTWKLWTVWTAFLYLLPLFKNPRVFSSFVASGLS